MRRMGNLPWVCPMLTRCGNVYQGDTGGTGEAVPRVSNAVSQTNGAEQGPGADGFQRPLVPRSRFQPQLRPGVRLTKQQR